MAEKFGNFRWVKDGYLDNRSAGLVVGRMTFAVIGTVSFCLRGDFKNDIAGKAFSFRNSQYLDDELAGDRLADLAVPQLGEVSLISFDPHPLLPPHPYIEWFSEDDVHYRIELAPEDAWILEDEKARQFDGESDSLRTALAPRLESPRTHLSEDEWF
ncbi:MAG: hypothetical protein ACE1ZJ_01295 [Nitrospirales bacterium]